MAKSKRDPAREERIHEEIIVDAYGPEEQAMGWYYYLEDKIRFPFKAKCVISKVMSPLRRGESVDVLGLAPEDICSSDMLVLIRWQSRNMAVPLSQLTAISPDESTYEAINDRRSAGHRLWRCSGRSAVSPAPGSIRSSSRCGVAPGPRSFALWAYSCSTSTRSTHP